MKFSVPTRRLGALSLAVAAGIIAASSATPARAALSWYDPFTINDADPGNPATYVSGVLGGQDGGTGTFFTGTWQQSGGDDNVLAAGSLTRFGQSPASSGDKVSDQPATGCCNTARTGRQFATPLQNVDGTIYMGFLVNFGLGNVNDPHYRSVEFWDGGVGDSFQNMAIGVSSFGNFNDAVNDADGPGGVTANTQLSVRIDGIRELLGNDVETHHQLNEHLAWGDPAQYGQTHSVVVKFDLSTNDVEIGGPGDTVSFFLDPKPTDLVEPTPSLVIPNIDVKIDRMSSIVLFHFTETKPENPGAFDELRVGSTWGDVAILGVPEPASLSLVGLGAFGLLTIARRKRA